VEHGKCNCMKAKIAVATVNGRAYYELVTELQRKRLPFLSLKRFPAEVKVVRVGKGPPEYTKTLLSLLDKALPEETLVETVSEAGTSRLTNNSVNRRVIRDAVSAIKIAGRNDQVFSRKNVQ